MSKIMLYFALGNQQERFMKKVLHFVFIEHPLRLLATLGLLALAIHWGFLGFALLSVPMFAIWENILP